jgi:hypothetical protein
MNKNQWDTLMLIYQNCEGWIGYSIDSIPYWFSTDERKKCIFVSAEPHGLMFDALMNKEEWEKWLRSFIEKSSNELGFDVFDMEE